MICAVVGDSIAEAVQSYFPECTHNTKIGISSAAVVSRTPSGKDVVIISAGSNDPKNPSLLAHLREIQKRAGHVIWILPINPTARKAVEQVAAENQEPTVGFTPAKDHVHPRNNRVVAVAIRKVPPRGG